MRSKQSNIADTLLYDIAGPTRSTPIIEEVGDQRSVKSSFLSETISSLVSSAARSEQSNTIDEAPGATEFDVEDFSDEIVNLPFIQSRGRQNTQVRALQEWEGSVTSIDQDRFFASLIDLTLGETEQEEQVEIQLEDVRDQDLPLLKVGAIFRLVVGVVIDPSGTERKTVTVYFRRMLKKESNSAFLGVNFSTE